MPHQRALALSVGRMRAEAPYSPAPGRMVWGAGALLSSRRLSMAWAQAMVCQVGQGLGHTLTMHVFTVMKKKEEGIHLCCRGKASGLPTAFGWPAPLIKSHDAALTHYAACLGCCDAGYGMVGAYGYGMPPYPFAGMMMSGYGYGFPGYGYGQPMQGYGYQQQAASQQQQQQLPRGSGSTGGRGGSGRGSTYGFLPGAPAGSSPHIGQPPQQ